MSDKKTNYNYLFKYIIIGDTGKSISLYINNKYIYNNSRWKIKHFIKIYLW